MTAAPADKWDIILDAAYRVFGSKGFYEAKMADIADEAGIAKGTLYLYVTSKEALFVAMTERDFARFLEGVKEIVERKDGFSNRLEAVARHHLHYYYEARSYPRRFFHIPNNDDSLMRVIRAFMQTYTGLLGDLMVSGGVAKPQLHAKSLTGMLDVFRMDILFDPNFTETDLRERTAFAVSLFRSGAAIGQ